jgi:hypothetical protein
VSAPVGPTTLSAIIHGNPVDRDYLQDLPPSVEKVLEIQDHIRGGLETRKNSRSPACICRIAATKRLSLGFAGFADGPLRPRRPIKTESARGVILLSEMGEHRVKISEHPQEVRAL